jgi:peptidoglycan hydrolase CwlO-like protein
VILTQAIPDVPDGAPPWVYVVAVAAAVIVAAITGAPTIIEKLRANTSTPKDAKSSAAPETQPMPQVVEPPTDTLRSMIIDLQARLTKAEDKEDKSQVQIVELTRQLATAQAQIESLRSQIQVMQMDRRSG